MSELSSNRILADAHERAVLVLTAGDPLADALVACLTQHGFSACVQQRPDAPLAALGDSEPMPEAAVYLPSARPRPAAGPDLGEAARAFALCAEAKLAHVVLVSSAEVYGASPRNPGLMSETRGLVREAKNIVARGFMELEALARARLPASVKLTILRPCPLPLRGRGDYFSRLFARGAAFTVAGHDPSIQALHANDFGAAVALALETREPGVFNLAPDDVIPLHAALALCGQPRVPLPRGLQGVARALAPSDPLDQLDYIRYSFTISNRKARSVLGFSPRHTSGEALLALHGASATSSHAAGLPAYDPFGLDARYVAKAGRLLLEFMAKHYFRIEVEGLEHVPHSGKAVLAGLHRGLVAWDALMVMHLLARRLGRHPRFLAHPTAFQFPFAFDLTTKLGGLVACQENADFVLEHGELLGIFPEGMRGVFSLYKDVYRVGKFGRNAFVKIALRNRAPIVAFVIVGSAETYPILGKVEWPWLRRKTEWPFFPLTPTLFPLMPAPLPSKWYLRFLPPVELAGYPPDAAKDGLLVRSIGAGIKHEMQAAIDELIARRPSVFSR